MDWARICIDVNDRQDVMGWSVEVHHGESLLAVHVFPNGPFDDPAETLRDAVDWIHEQYGTQLRLAVF